MGTTRTSQKDVLEAVNGLGEQLAALVSIMTQQQQTAAVEPSVTTVTEPEPKPAKQASVKVDRKYFNHMLPKWQQLANAKGVAYIGFAYRKSSGRTGLWACPASEFSKVSRRDNFLGAVAEVKPQ